MTAAERYKLVRWLAVALAGVVAVYLVLNWADGDASVHLADAPLLMALAALALPFRRPHPGELADRWVVVITFAVVTAAMAPGTYAPTTSAGPAVETVATVLLFGGLLLLPIILGPRAILPFLAALVVAMALDPSPSMVFPSTERDASVFHWTHIVIAAFLIVLSTLMHPLAFRVVTGRWPA